MVRSARAGCLFAVFLICVAPAALAQEPARYLAGGVPSQPPNIVGWEQATAAIHIDESGSVTKVTMLRTTPGFGDRVEAALTGWRFHPAMDEDNHPIGSETVVSFIYRPPVLYNVATIGNPPEVRAVPPPDVPFPTSTNSPMYPVSATGDDVVVMQVNVSAEGAVTKAGLLSPPSGFDKLSLDAARQWHYQPAQIDGHPAPAVAYIVVGFRQPVTGGIY